MPRLSCKELGGDCDYVAEADTIEDVKRELLTHAARTHRHRIETMSQDEREAFDIRIDQVLRGR
ncbi:MAG: DUF1059 domain-containing protein [Gemmatimonadetes bacterium]|nr:DUF1059 domain-containing protein [Gemmatimonadota bacterium]